MSRNILNADAPISLLFLSNDRFPATRPDVAVLFGKVLIGRGWNIDWIQSSQAESRHAQCHTLKGGRAWVGGSCSRSAIGAGLRRWLRDFIHDLRVLIKLRNRRYDFIQVKDKFVIVPFAAAFAYYTKARFIFWLSYPYSDEARQLAKETWGPRSWRQTLRAALFDLMFFGIVTRTACHIVVQSDYLRQRVVSLGVPAHLVTAVPMGVDCVDAHKTPEHPRSIGNASERAVVYIGTLSRLRRLDFLVHAFSIVADEVADARLYIVGGEAREGDAEELRRAARHLSIEAKVTLTGPLSMRDAWAYVRHAKVCVSPFAPSVVLEAASPTKVLEYMALERPVVATEQPDQCTVLAESGGGVCVPYDVAAFARAIISMLGDDEGARRMGLEGRKWVCENRDYHVLATAVAALYTTLRRKQ